MLEITKSFDMLESKIENNNNEIIRYNSDDSDKKPNKKSRKLFKSQNLFKSKKYKLALI